MYRQAFADGDIASTSPLGTCDLCHCNGCQSACTLLLAQAIVRPQSWKAQAPLQTWSSSRSPPWPGERVSGTLAQADDVWLLCSWLLMRSHAMCVIIEHVRRAASLLRLRRLGDAMLRNGENACYNVYVESRSAVMDKALQVRTSLTAPKNPLAQHV